MQTYLERAAPEVLSVSAWFEPPPHPASQSVTIRFSGRRLGPTGQPKAGDRFVHDETVEGIVAGCGPVSVTATIRGVNAGRWAVDARILSSRAPKRASTGKAGSSRDHRAQLSSARWSWWPWRSATAPAPSVATCLAPFARPPGIVPGSWALLAAVGMALALTVQSLLFATTDLHAGHVLAASLLSLLAGAAGAKLWFLVLERRARDRNGWCMQGLIAGVAVVAPPLLWLLDIPVGAFFDTAAPGLMFGLAIGRIGCFFTGCCTGRPSGSRWAIWASDRHLGARRLPTQLLECALALAVGVVTLVVFLRIGPHHGNLFIGAVAGYTLIRQALLRLRDERRRTRHGLRLVGVTASIVLALDLALFALI